MGSTFCFPFFSPNDRAHRQQWSAAELLSECSALIRQHLELIPHFIEVFHQILVIIQHPNQLFYFCLVVVFVAREMSVEIFHQVRQQQGHQMNIYSKDLTGCILIRKFRTCSRLNLNCTCCNLSNLRIYRDYLHRKEAILVLQLTPSPQTISV